MYDFVNSKNSAFVIALFSFEHNCTCDLVAFCFLTYDFFHRWMLVIIVLTIIPRFLQTWATDASVRNGEERVSTPKSDGGSSFTSPTKSISFDNRFDRSYSISSRATPLQLDPSFVTPSSSRRDLLSTSTSMADLSATSASEPSIILFIDVCRLMTWTHTVIS